MSTMRASSVAMAGSAGICGGTGQRSCHILIPGRFSVAYFIMRRTPWAVVLSFHSGSSMTKWE